MLPSGGGVNDCLCNISLKVGLIELGKGKHIYLTSIWGWGDGFIVKPIHIVIIVLFVYLSLASTLYIGMFL